MAKALENNMLSWHVKVAVGIYEYATRNIVIVFRVFEMKKISVIGKPRPGLVSCHGGPSPSFVTSVW